TPSLGPDATGVGWVYQYVVLAKDRSLAELRTIQDWYLRYQLAKTEGVAEVASVGGMVSSTILTLIVIPAIYALIKQAKLENPQ
ncbi:MAG: hypothetical protein H7Z12_01295, partial [Rhodospirillaceae bacterium]|nr:hypothetical protein [Rhodospirillales bacterium]